MIPARGWACNPHAQAPLMSWPGLAPAIHVVLNQNQTMLIPGTGIHLKNLSLFSFGYFALLSSRASRLDIGSTPFVLNRSAKSSSFIQFL